MGESAEKGKPVMTPKVVLDTNVLISALGWAGPESKVFHQALKGDLELVISPDLIDEFLRVARYPKLSFSNSEIDGFLGRLLRCAYVIRPVLTINMVKEDAGDNVVLACALSGRANRIITGDAHLLKLNDYEGIRIVKAGGCLRMVRSE